MHKPTKRFYLRTMNYYENGNGNGIEIEKNERVAFVNYIKMLQKTYATRACVCECACTHESLVSSGETFQTAIVNISLCILCGFFHLFTYSEFDTLEKKIHDFIEYEKI